MTGRYAEWSHKSPRHFTRTARHYLPKHLRASRRERPRQQPRKHLPDPQTRRYPDPESPVDGKTGRDGRRGCRPLNGNLRLGPSAQGSQQAGASERFRGAGIWTGSGLRSRRRGMIAERMTCGAPHPTSQYPALSDPTRRSTPAAFSLRRWYFTPSGVTPTRSASSRRVSSGSALQVVQDSVARGFLADLGSFLVDPGSFLAVLGSRLGSTRIRAPSSSGIDGLW